MNVHKSTCRIVVLKTISAICFRVLLIATFAVWFGGFTFYVSFVVPAGTEVLGSARSQGFITQIVTHWINVMAAVAVIMMLLESIRGWKMASSGFRLVQASSVVLIGIMLLGLVWLHPTMDRMLDVQAETVTDPERFYGLHRIYLWASTFQWIAAWIWLFATVTLWNLTSETTSGSKS